MKLGARMFKTGLGVALSILIANWLPFVEPGIPAFTAVIGLQQTVRGSIDTFFNRVIAAILGGIVAVFMVYFFGNSALVIGVTVMIFIAILNALKMPKVITLASITVVVIMLNDPNFILESAVARVVESLLGVTVSLLVNLFVLPPKYDAILYEEVNKTTNEVLVRLRAILRKNGEYSSLTSDIAWAQNHIVTAKSLFKLLKDENVWSKKKLPMLKRKLVVFRAFIAASEESLALLSVLHTHTNIMFQLPEELRIQIRERIETLCSAHEQIFLKFDGRISPLEVNFFKPTQVYRQELMETIFEYATLGQKATPEEFERSNALMLITGQLVSYEESLIHLNTLIRSYRIHHDEDEYQADSLEGFEG